MEIKAHINNQFMKTKITSIMASCGGTIFVSISIDHPWAELASERERDR